MTAPLFNLPITAPITGGPAANPAGQAALGGFEAMLAAFFGGEAADAATGLLGSALGQSDAPASGEGKASADAAENETAVAVDPLAMAAMLMTTPAPIAAAAVAVAVADAALGGEDEAASAKSTPAAAAFVVPETAADALLVGEVLPTAGAATDETPEVALAPVGQAIDASAPETISPLAKPLGKTGLEAEPQPELKATQEPKTAQHAATAPAPVAHPRQPPPPPKEAPAPQPLAEAVAASERAVETAEPAETQPHPAPRANRHADAARRQSGDLASAAPPADDNVLPNAVTGVVSAEAAGEPAASLEAEPAVPAPAGREAKTEASSADAPDFQLPAQASAVAHAHSNAVAAHGQQARATSETVANLTAQMSKKLEGRSTKFDVELTPAGLGQVNIAVEIAASGKMTAAMSFETPQAAAELRARANELQRALEQAGFDLSGGLSFDVAGDQGRQAQQQQQQHDGAAWRGRAFQAVLGTAGEAAETAATAALHYARRSETGVDVRI